MYCRPNKKVAMLKHCNTLFAGYNNCMGPWKWPGYLSFLLGGLQVNCPGSGIDNYTTVSMQLTITKADHMNRWDHPDS